MKQIQLEQTEYQKVTKLLPFNLPTEPLYLFMFGTRLSVRIIPIYTSWRKEQGEEEEEIWKLHITTVSEYSTMIESKYIHIHDITGILRDNSETKILLQFMSSGDKTRELRTKEQFDLDFNNVLKRIQEHEKDYESN